MTILQLAIHPAHAKYERVKGLEIVYEHVGSGPRDKEHSLLGRPSSLGLWHPRAIKVEKRRDRSTNSWWNRNDSSLNTIQRYSWHCKPFFFPELFPHYYLYRTLEEWYSPRVQDVDDTNLARQAF